MRKSAFLDEVGLLRLWRMLMPRRKPPPKPWIPGFTTGSYTSETEHHIQWYWISLENLKRRVARRPSLSPARSSQGQLLGRAHSTTPLQFLGRCNLYFALTSAASRATAVWVILSVSVS